jgi:hypothetical protein
MERPLFSFMRRDIKRKIVLATGPRFPPHYLDTARKVGDSLAGRFFQYRLHPFVIFPVRPSHRKRSFSGFFPKADKLQPGWR